MQYQQKNGNIIINKMRRKKKDNTNSQRVVEVDIDAVIAIILSDDKLMKYVHHLVRAKLAATPSAYHRHLVIELIDASIEDAIREIKLVDLIRDVKANVARTRENQKGKSSNYAQTTITQKPSQPELTDELLLRHKYSIDTTVPNHDHTKAMRVLHKSEMLPNFSSTEPTQVESHSNKKLIRKLNTKNGLVNVDPNRRNLEGRDNPSASDDVTVTNAINARANSTSLAAFSQFDSDDDSKEASRDQQPQYHQQPQHQQQPQPPPRQQPQPLSAHIARTPTTHPATESKPVRAQSHASPSPSSTDSPHHGRDEASPHPQEESPRDSLDKKWMREGNEDRWEASADKDIYPEDFDSDLSPSRSLPEGRTVFNSIDEIGSWERTVLKNLSDDRDQERKEEQREVRGGRGGGGSRGKGEEMVRGEDADGEPLLGSVDKSEEALPVQRQEEEVEEEEELLEGEERKEGLQGERLHPEENVNAQERKPLDLARQYKSILCRVSRIKETVSDWADSSNGIDGGEDSRGDDRPPARVQFIPDIVAEIQYRDRVSLAERSVLFYTHEEESQFIRDYNREGERADAMGLTWTDWIGERTDEDVQRDEELAKQQAADLYRTDLDAEDIEYMDSFEDSGGEGPTAMGISEEEEEERRRWTVGFNPRETTILKGFTDEDEFEEAGERENEHEVIDSEESGMGLRSYRGLTSNSKLSSTRYRQKDTQRSGNDVLHENGLSRVDVNDSDSEDF